MAASTPGSLPLPLVAHVRASGMSSLVVKEFGSPAIGCGGAVVYQSLSIRHTNDLAHF